MRADSHDPENPTSEIWKISFSNLTHTNGCNPGAAQLLLASQAAGLATLICIIYITVLLSWSHSSHVTITLAERVTITLAEHVTITLAERVTITLAERVLSLL
jgi:hypothetical protein